MSLRDLGRVMRRDFRRVLRVAAALAILACDHAATSGPALPPSVLVRVGGDWQTAPGGARLADPLAIRAIDPVTLAPIPRLPVRFSVERGHSSGAWITDTLAITGLDGVARTVLTLGRDDGAQVVVAARVGQGPAQEFTAIVTPTPVVRAVLPPSAGGGDTVTLVGSLLQLARAPGVVRFNGVPVSPVFIGDTLVRAVVPPCLPTGSLSVTVTNGGARADSARMQSLLHGTPISLPTLGGVQLGAAQLGDCVVLPGGGAHYLVVAHVDGSGTAADSLDVTIGANSVGGSAFRATPAPARAPRGGAALVFESVLRARGRALASSAPRPAAAVRTAAEPPPVGTLRSFRVIANLSATNFATATARLRFVGEHILVWVDTASPPELPDSLLMPLARLFDTELYPLDEDAFGEPSDVDGNGRVHVVLTPIVNGLTRTDQCSLSSFVAGFFSAHDLYPSEQNSNGGEAFYGFVPDTLGTRGCPHGKGEFDRDIRDAFVHELQHVISYNEHVFRRGGLEEDNWLNEGMSHIAEELASKVYERRYPSPLGRTSPAQIFPDSSQAFINFNLINAFLFLRQPFANSVTQFIDAGTLEERGAAWLFLRWLADQYGEDVFRRLEQTPLHGRANVEDKVGEPFTRLVGDFALATYADSLVGIPRTAVSPRWRYQTRNWRVIFQRLHDIYDFPVFPIDPIPLPYNGTASGTVRVGGFVMLSLDVPAGAAGTTLRFTPLDGGPWPATLTPHVSVFRLP